MNSFENFYENCCEVEYGNLLRFQEVFSAYRNFYESSGLEKNRLTRSNLFSRFKKLNNDVRAYKIDRVFLVVNLALKPKGVNSKRDVENASIEINYDKTK